MDKYQTIIKRFWAANIDSLVTMVFLWMITIAVFSNFSSPMVLFAVQALIGFISVFYYIILHFYYGKTLGKMAMKVKVTDTFGEDINLGQSITRSLPQLVPVLFMAGFGVLLSSSAQQVDESEKAFAENVINYTYAATMIWNVADIIVALSNDKHRALHDYIAGTVVVKI